MPRNVMGVSLQHFLDVRPARAGRSVTRYFVYSMSLIAAVGIAGCDKAPPPKAGKNPRVVVTKPVIATVMDYQDFTGRLDAVKTVEIRARASGYVTEAPFQEGAV